MAHALKRYMALELTARECYILKELVNAKLDDLSTTALGNIGEYQDLFDILDSEQAIQRIREEK